MMDLRQQFMTLITRSLVRAGGCLRGGLPVPREAGWLIFFLECFCSPSHVELETLSPGRGRNGEVK